MLDLGLSFLSSVARDPNALAIVDGELRLTYAQWYRRISALVAALDSLGLAPGDHIVTALQNRFRDHTITIFNKHHMTSIGYCVPQDSPQNENTLIYIIAHESRDAAKKNWAEFVADPEWQQVAKASEADGKIVEKIDSTYMNPADYSQIQ